MTEFGKSKMGVVVNKMVKKIGIFKIAHAIAHLDMMLEYIR